MRLFFLPCTAVRTQRTAHMPGEPNVSGLVGTGPVLHPNEWYKEPLVSPKGDNSARQITAAHPVGLLPGKLQHAHPAAILKIRA